MKSKKELEERIIELDTIIEKHADCDGTVIGGDCDEEIFERDYIEEAIKYLFN